MELDQKLTFSTKNYQYVASPPDVYFSDTVLLFEPRMRHPALRVTVTKNLFKINVFLRSSLKFSIKFDKNSIFSLFSLFSKICENFVRIFDLAIMYRRTRDPHQIHRSKKLSPKINSDQNLNGWSLIKN